MFWSVFSQQLNPTFAVCDVVTSRSQPPNCKLKQMSDEVKGLLLHNRGDLPQEQYDALKSHYTNARGFEEIHKKLKCKPPEGDN